MNAPYHVPPFALPQHALPQVEPFFFDVDPGTRFCLYHAPTRNWCPAAPSCISTRSQKSST